MPTRPLACLGILALLAGCVAAPPADGGGTGPVASSFSGVATATPVAPLEARFVFDVPPGATEVRARLSFASSAADLALALLDPSGAEAGVGFPETATEAALATVDPPAPGAWTAAVRATRAWQEPFELDVEVGFATPGPSFLRDAFRLEPRLQAQELLASPHGGYAMVNLVLEEGARVEFSWTSSRPVAFDVQTGAEPERRDPEPATESMTGEFVAPSRALYSMLWRNDNPEPATVEVVADGVFREHSRTR